VFDSWGRSSDKIAGLPFKTCIYEKYDRQIFVVRSGPGQIAASAAAQMAISSLGAEEIWNFGVAGGLIPEMTIGKIFVPGRIFRWDSDVDDQPVQVSLPHALNLIQNPNNFDRVNPDDAEKSDKSDRSFRLEKDHEMFHADVDMDSLTSKQKRDNPWAEYDILKSIEVVTLASGDRVVAKAEHRQALSQRYGAAAVEMEAAAIAATSARNGVKAYFVKGISDAITTSENDLMNAFKKTAAATFEVMDILLKHQQP